jgi:hypothetical protein
MTKTGAGENREKLNLKSCQTIMMNKMKALSLAAFATVAAVSTSHAATTNILQSITVQFTVYSQGATTTNKAGTITTPITSSSLITKGLVAALGSDTNITAKGFSSSAILALDTVVEGTNISTSVVVVDGTNIVKISTNFISNFAPLSGSVPLVSSQISKSGSTFGELMEASMSLSIGKAWSLQLYGTAGVTESAVALGKGKTATSAPIYDSNLNLTGFGLEGTSPVVVAGTIKEAYLKTLVQ